MDKALKEITPKSEDFSQWYTDVVKKADLMDYAPVKGFIVIRPYAYRIWEFIQADLDARFRATGHENAYFPLLIPESLLTREAEHVEGFSPEVAWVTIGGGEVLSERLAVRPTSETIVGAMYARWIQSYRDLPVLINQWNSVVRWEKSTRPFLRTTEFLWQEGHTVHRTEDEAVREAEQQLEAYRGLMQEVLAIPAVSGVKSAGERFAGAVETYTLEALMGDGRALQAATSHFLGQNFSKAFDIQFLDEDGALKYGWTTSWGASTRLLGALIMVHGDDRGLRLPPRVAPIQVVIVPIGKGGERAQIVEYCHALKKRLDPSTRVMVDDRDEFTPGYKFNDWEMRGVPLRLEVGPRDVAAGQVMASRRDGGAKFAIVSSELERAVSVVLDEIQHSLYAQALANLKAGSWEITDYQEALARDRRGFFYGDWCGEEACAAHLQEETSMTIRCLPLGLSPALTGCAVCHQPSRHRVVFARAY